jgi:hypothetical protein
VRMVVREISKQDLLLQFLGLSQYISKSYVIRRASYIKCFDKEEYICGWVNFVHMGEQRKQILVS